MKKRLLSLLVSAVLCSVALPAAAWAGFENFTSTKSYYEGQFSDVATADWFAENVRMAYQLGLIDGKAVDVFDPDSDLTLAEAVKVAAVLHSIYVTNDVNFSSAQPWYQPYVDYARENGILAAEFPDYSATATRAQFAVLFASALPDEAYEVINDVEDGSIPDVSETSLYSRAVYKLYRAGILTGSDAKGSFRPADGIRRSEVAAIATRMANPSLRRSITLFKPTESETSIPTPEQTNLPDPEQQNVSGPLSSEQVFALCSPAVFYIEVYNAAGETLSSGSGVFLSSTGEAMTNYHVIEGASGARIRTTDGRVYNVSGVYDYDEERDLARIQVAGSGFSSLSVSETVNTGQTVYAIGSPMGLENTISNGIVSAASRTVNGQEYIQTTASISHGSSGGALIDTQGNLIGITSAYIDGGQNLNLAIPVKDFAKLERASVQTFEEVLQSNRDPYYETFPTVPDFGTFSGAQPSSTVEEGKTATYIYQSTDFTTGDFTTVVNSYAALLMQSGFELRRVERENNIQQNTYVGAHNTVVLLSVLPNPTRVAVSISL